MGKLIRFKSPNMSLQMNELPGGMDTFAVESASPNSAFRKWPLVTAFGIVHSRVSFKQL